MEYFSTTVCAFGTNSLILALTAAEYHLRCKQIEL